MCLIIGNLFGLISSIFLGVSVFGKSKKSMIAYQIIDCCFAILSSLVLHGYNGAVASFIALVRNILEWKNKATKAITAAIIFLTIVVSVFTTIKLEKTWYALLPMLASVEYTIGLFVCTKYTHCKLTLLLNEILWLIYLFFIQSYAQVFITLILIITNIISIVMSEKPISDNGLTKYQRNKLKFEISKLNREENH